MAIKSALTALSFSLASAFVSGALAAGPCVDFSGTFNIVESGKVVETVTLGQTACEAILVTYSDATKQTLAMDGIGRIMQTAPNGRTLEFVGFNFSDRSRFTSFVMNPAGALLESSIFTMSLTATGDILATTGSLSSVDKPTTDAVTLVKVVKPAPGTPAPAPAHLQKFLRKFAH